METRIIWHVNTLSRFIQHSLLLQIIVAEIVADTAAAKTIRNLDTVTIMKHGRE